jgi:hypothetical protein
MLLLSHYIEATKDPGLAADLREAAEALRDETK